VKLDIDRYVFASFIAVMVFGGYLLWQEIATPGHVKLYSIVKCENDTQCIILEPLILGATADAINVTLFGLVLLIGATTLFLFIRKHTGQKQQSIP
jgi:hypothetical protein